MSKAKLRPGLVGLALAAAAAAGVGAAPAAPPADSRFVLAAFHESDVFLFDTPDW